MTQDPSPTFHVWELDRISRTAGVSVDSVPRPPHRLRAEVSLVVVADDQECSLEDLRETIRRLREVAAVLEEHASAREAGQAPA